MESAGNQICKKLIASHVRLFYLSPPAFFTLRQHTKTEKSEANPNEENNSAGGNDYGGNMPGNLFCGKYH